MHFTQEVNSQFLSVKEAVFSCEVLP